MGWRWRALRRLFSCPDSGLLTLLYGLRSHCGCRIYASLEILRLLCSDPVLAIVNDPKITMLESLTVGSCRSYDIHRVISRWLKMPHRQVVDLNIGCLRTACLASHLGGKNYILLQMQICNAIILLIFFSTLKSLG